MKFSYHNVSKVYINAYYHCCGFYMLETMYAQLILTYMSKLKVEFNYSTIASTIQLPEIA